MKPEHAQKEVAAFQNFLNGFALFPLQLGIAKQHNCWIEALVIQTAFADALLRIAIVLKTQLVEGHSDIDFIYLWQPERSKNLMEREIYSHAQKKGVVDQRLFDHLEELYAERNKGIHRLFTSDLKYTDLLPVSMKWDRVIEELREIVAALEDEQDRKKVGMCRKAGPSDFDDNALKIMVLQKL